VTDKKPEEIIHDAGLRCTPGRVAILVSLMECENPMTHKEVLSDVEETGLDRVSVYRALKAFHEAGVLHQVDTGDGVKRYALCLCGGKQHCHPHFMCRRCGKVECLNDVSLPDLLQPKEGYVVQGQEVYFKGLCPECSAQQRSVNRSKR